MDSTPTKPKPEPEPELKLEGHDPKTELATFTCAQATYTVQVGVDSDSRLEVAIANGDKLHRDRFDLAVEAQRQRFASSASARTGIRAHIALRSQVIRQEIRHVQGKVGRLHGVVLRGMT